MFTSLTPPDDLWINPTPSRPHEAVVGLWKDAKALARLYPEVAVAGPLRTRRGLDLLVRNLLANPQISVLYVTGKDQTPGGETLQAFRDLRMTRRSSWVGADIPQASVERLLATLSVEEIPYGSPLPGKVFGGRGDPSEIYPPPAPVNQDTAPSGAPGERLEGLSLAALWPRVLRQARCFGVELPSPSGVISEYPNLTSVVPLATALDGWEVRLPGFPELAHVRDYYLRLLDGAAPDGVEYTYGSRLGEQRLAVQALLDGDPHSRVGFMTTWRLEDSGKSSNRPCLVGVQQRVIDGRLNLTLVFRSHDLFAGWPLNLGGWAMYGCARASALGVLPGFLVCHSVSAHVYQRDWVDADKQVAEISRELRWDRRSQWHVGKGSNGQLVVKAFNPDTEQLLRTFEGSSVATLRAEIEASGLVTEIGAAMWLGAELQRVREV